jgi:DNA repair exonuclease SbcCD ATPase subunit
MPYKCLRTKSPTVREAQGTDIELLLKPILAETERNVTELEKAGKHDKAEEARRVAGTLEIVLREHLAESLSINQRATKRKSQVIKSEDAQIDSIMASNKIGEELLNARHALQGLVAKKEKLIAENRLAEAERVDNRIRLRQSEVSTLEEIYRIASETMVTLQKQFEQLQRQAAELENNGKAIEADEARQKADEVNTQMREQAGAYGALRLKHAFLQAEIEMHMLDVESDAQPTRVTYDRDSAYDTGASVMASIARLEKLLQQWRALEGSADAPKNSGLENNAQGMTKVSEQMQRELIRIRESLSQESLKSRLRTQLSVAAAPSYAQLPELHRTLTELREQVQELRKEVGQLKELLANKP